MNNILCPCHHCEERVLKCHATCEKYKEFRTALNRRSHIIFLNNTKENMLDNYMKENRKRWVK